MERNRKFKVKLVCHEDDFNSNKDLLRKVSIWDREAFILFLKHGGNIRNGIKAMKLAGEISKRTALTTEDCIHLAPLFVNLFKLMESDKSKNGITFSHIFIDEAKNIKNT